MGDIGGLLDELWSVYDERYKPLTRREMSVICQAYRDLCKMKFGDTPTTWMRIVFRSRRLLRMFAAYIRYMDAQPA